LNLVSKENIDTASISSKLKVLEVIKLIFLTRNYMRVNRMRFGCCGNLIATGPDKTGIEFVEKIATLGYDYVELPLAEMMALSISEFVALKERVYKSGIRCEACNNLFPTQVRLTGPKVNRQQISEYINSAIERAAELGVGVLVFGSGGAKRVPDNFHQAEALAQIVAETKLLAEVAGRHNITIAIEPMRRPDCNIINSFAEGVELAKLVNCANVKVLIDIYHMVCEKESPNVLLKYGKEYLAHIHFSNPHIPCIDGSVDSAKINTLFEWDLAKKGWWRTFPTNLKEWDYGPFIKAVQALGYNGRISVEAPTTNFDEQAKEALALLKITFA